MATPPIWSTLDGNEDQPSLTLLDTLEEDALFEAIQHDPEEQKYLKAMEQAHDTWRSLRAQILERFSRRWWTLLEQYLKQLVRLRVDWGQGFVATQVEQKETVFWVTLQNDQQQVHTQTIPWYTSLVGWSTGYNLTFSQTWLFQLDETKRQLNRSLPKDVVGIILDYAIEVPVLQPLTYHINPSGNMGIGTSIIQPLQIESEQPLLRTNG